MTGDDMNHLRSLKYAVMSEFPCRFNKMLFAMAIGVIAVLFLLKAEAKHRASHLVIHPSGNPTVRH
jgi:hypothetical protein